MVHEALGERVQIPGLDPEDLPLHGYYRSLEHLNSIKGAVEKAVHLRVADLFNRDVSVVFYDLTSTYFEGKGCSTARHGYSRDHRPDLVQIQLGLLVDGDGVPVAHEVFPGNVRDCCTVLDALERLQRDFEVRRCVFVGDDCMSTAENLRQIAARGYEYITSLSLRHSKTGKSLLESRPPLRAFETLLKNLRVCPMRTTEDGVRYIGSYNPFRAVSNREHRTRRMRECVAGLRELQASAKPQAPRRDVVQLAAAVLKRTHCNAFFTLGQNDQGVLTWKLDSRALRLERAQDGLTVLVTNSRTLTDGEVALGYRQLWRVENAFRHLKDPIRLRPIRHWNDARVLGHVFVCVLAYMLERLMDLRLQRAGLAMTARAAIRKLKTLKVSTLSLEDRQVRRRSEITTPQSQVLAAVGVHTVPEIW